MRRIELDFSAQPGHPQVDRPMESFHLAMRGHLQQPFAPQRPNGVFGEHLEQVEFARGPTGGTLTTGFQAPSPSRGAAYRIQAGYFGSAGRRCRDRNAA
jgi:hypothetical protein